MSGVDKPYVALQSHLTPEQMMMVSDLLAMVSQQLIDRETAAYDDGFADAAESALANAAALYFHARLATDDAASHLNGVIAEALDAARRQEARADEAAARQ